jgi:hypothetical protein
MHGTVKKEIDQSLWLPSKKIAHTHPIFVPQTKRYSKKVENRK